MTSFDLLLNAIHQGKNPYQDFPAAQWGGTWYGDPGAARSMFAKAIELTRPGIIIEVGSFVGESAIHMAKIIKERKVDAAILCVDTWYAGFDHWLGARDKIQMHFGRPDFYYKFMANVIIHECQDVIVPFAMDSIGAARVIKWLGLKAALVYVDGSHEKGDVFRDYETYWELLEKTGGMLCDDWSAHFPGVMEDGHRFSGLMGISPTMVEGEKVLFKKFL